MINILNIEIDYIYFNYLKYYMLNEYNLVTSLTIEK